MSRDFRVRIALPPWAKPYRRPARYKIAYGGRGSAKSWTFARMLVLRAVEEPVRVLCGRELQNSIQDSVHQLIADQITETGLSGAFQVNERRITSYTGAEFMFKGLRGMKNNAAQIKSLEGVDICWLEEAQTISKASLETLIPTIRKPGSEIWITFNPDQETDPVYQLAMNPPPGSIVRKVNWDQNPWFPRELELERKWMQRTDPDAYAHVWEGECRRYTDAQVLRGKWCVESFEPNPVTWHGPYYGADWGFAEDPSVLVRCWIFEGRLYIEHEAYGVGVEVDELPALFDSVPGSRDHTIRADSARPETISYMRRQGFRMSPAKKGKGSVEDGVAHLRSYERIVIHPRCRHAQEEARLWSWKVDKLSGDILPVLVDAHNHCWDAVRYALEPIIRKGLSAGEYATAGGRIF